MKLLFIEVIISCFLKSILQKGMKNELGKMFMYFYFIYSNKRLQAEEAAEERLINLVLRGEAEGANWSPDGSGLSPRPLSSLESGQLSPYSPPLSESATKREETALKLRRAIRRLEEARKRGFNKSLNWPNMIYRLASFPTYKAK